MNIYFSYLFKRQLFYVAMLLFYAGVTFGQDSSSYKYSQLKEQLTATYLSDTLHAPAKIRELIKSAMESDDRLTAIEKYEMAFALAPYAADSIDVLTSLYARFSGLLYNAGAHDMSIEYAKKAFVYCNKTHPEASEWKYNILGKIASFYLNYNRYDSSARYFILARKEAAALGKPIWNAAATNNIGMLYEAQNFHDTAYSLFSMAKNMLQSPNRYDSVLLGSINDNIAQNFYIRNHFEEAYNFYKQNLVLYKNLNNEGGVFKTELGLASSCISMHKFDEAQQIIADLENMPPAENHKKVIEGQIKVLNVLKQFASENGDWKKAMEEQNKITALTDTLSKLQKETADGLMRALAETEVLKAHKDIEVYQMHLKEKENALQESRKTATLRLIITLLVALTSAVAIALLLLYFRHLSRLRQHQIKIGEYKQELARKEMEKQKLEQEKLEQELQFKKGDLHDLGIYLSKVKDVHSTISEKLQEIKNQKGGLQKETIATLLNELNTQIYSQQRLQIIQESIEEVNREFYDKLLKFYPNLTKSELELCGFFKLNMSNKEISALKGISHDSVKMGRYRLRKKLELKSNEDIYKKLAEL
jgi:DNA-binding CsgD family transcriptional regulator